MVREPGGSHAARSSGDPSRQRAGLAIGIPVAIFCVRYVKSQLFEITGVNVPVMGIAIGVLVITAAVAGIIPARRAASIDPVRALRIE